MHETSKVHRRPWPFFSWIESWHLQTRGLSAYEAAADDPQKFAALTELMERFFRRPIDMFPESSSPGPIQRPRRFFELQRELIDERFPGGSGEFGDADIRALISEFQSIFSVNIAKFVVSKKLILLVAGLAPLFACTWALEASVWCGMVRAEWLCAPGAGLHRALVVLGVIATALILFQALNSALFQAYREKLDRTATPISHNMQARTKEFAKLFGELKFNIEHRQSKLTDERRADWPGDAGKWTVMAYWISQRLDYLERFVQIEMWRVRRAHYFVNRLGWLATWAIGAVLAVTAAVIAAVVLASQSSDRGLLLGELALATLANAFMTWTSYANASWRTPLTFVAEALHPQDWERYTDLELDRSLFEQARHDKQMRNEADAKLQK